ncbi:serine hydrolase domain-containing protein [Streptosporangium roseum]|uniref:serine hydrolase domain-containing protein n=1 Tax=Streptosporangium roseum TaxID=2001 RepID=UPI00332087A0
MPDSPGEASGRAGPGPEDGRAGRGGGSGGPGVVDGPGGRIGGAGETGGPSEGPGGHGASGCSATLAAILAAAVPAVCSAAVAVIAVDGTTVAAAARGELVRYAGASGALLADRPAVRRDSIFDLASLTKLYTTAVILSLAEEGRLGLDGPVATWLPGGPAGVTPRHLLTHTAGLPPGRRAHEEIPGDGPEVLAARLERIVSTPPLRPPGTSHLYSDVGMIMAGRVAEIAGGAPLDELLRARVTGPLGLDDTGYRPPPSLRPRIAATEEKPERAGSGCVRGEVHDETAHGLGGVAGHAGIFSTADDVVRFAEALRTGGAPILRPDTVAEMTRDQGAGGAAFGQGLGVRIGDPAVVGPLASAYGHSGFTGTALVVDPGLALTAVLLTNNVHPLRGRAGIRDLRHAVAAEALRLARAA